MLKLSLIHVLINFQFIVIGFLVGYLYQQQQFNTSNSKPGLGKNGNATPVIVHGKQETSEPSPLRVVEGQDQAKSRADEKRCRLRQSVTFRKMKDRAQLPHYINELELLGEAVEVGVRKGEYSMHMLRFWKGAKYHMVDPWEHQNETLYKDISNRNQDHQDSLFNNLVAFMQTNYPNRHMIHRNYSVDAALTFENDSLDFVYLDARHDYAGVKEDIEAWWPKLKTGGVFAGHDFVPDGEIHAGSFGVMKAVSEFATAQGKEFQTISKKRPDGGRMEPQKVDGGWSTWYTIK